MERQTGWTIALLIVIIILAIIGIFWWHAVPAP
ncbi:hypothetical protein SAMN06269301_3508 [Geobacter sp. DSM 9736]|nr:hypothetical protein SAMN06269301_3508 [Geobacter sp. DSM 9736]